MDVDEVELVDLRKNCRATQPLNPKSKIIASYTDGVVLVAWGQTVWINLFPLCNDEYGEWYEPTSDVPKLLANAVLYVARKDNV